ncbi:MAG: uracil-DNA glycosylase [Polaromonas sp.]|nr:uracil-DNA glycosylase [Polaromonas sp.]
MIQQANFAFDDAGLQNTSPERLTAWNPALWPIDSSWAPVVDGFLASSTGQKLAQFVAQRLADGAVIYPSHPLRALALTPLPAVKVVILGQDPYHGPNQAHGLAFSVRHGNRIPPSLRNIFKEIDRDAAQVGVASASQPVPSGLRSGSLEAWAQQGVLLLNTCMTVEDGAPGSHAKQGWEALTDALIQAVAAAADPVVFMLWGAHAQAKREQIKGEHLVLTANHPSPLSANRPPQPFLGCGHFVAANAWLQARGYKVIEWS